MNYTSIEQSKKLLELGLSPESADMAYLSEDSLYPKLNCAGMLFLEKGETATITPIPCWSVGALIEIMPKSIRHNEERVGCVRLMKDYCGYGFMYPSDYEDRSVISPEIGRNLIDVTYSMVVWLLENNYIKH